MRHKNIVNISQQTSNIVPNDLYRRFHRQFECLLNPDPGPIDSNLYLECPDSENALKTLLESEEDTIIHIVGFRGIGKSTLVEHVLNYNKNNPQISENTIILPSSCDSSYMPSREISEITARKLSSMNTSLIERFQKQPDHNMLYDSIMLHKSELLEYDHEQRQSAPQNPNHRKNAVDALYKNNRFAYEAERLKWILNNIDGAITTVIFVLDDLEALLWEREKDFILRFLTAYECMRNNTGRCYKVKLVLTSRPHTYREIRNAPEFNTHRFRAPLFIHTAPNLSDIFAKRFQHFSVQLDHRNRAKDKDEWDDAYGVLKQVSEKLYTNYGDVLLRLYNYDLSESMQAFAKILMNRRWIGRGKVPSAAFRIEEIRDYSITNANILFALACGESSKYKDNTEHPVANILHNQRDKQSDLLCTYIIRYLIAATPESSPNEYPTINLESLYQNNDLLDIPKEKYNDLLTEAIDYLERRQVIMLSPDEDRRTPEENNSLKVFLAPRGAALWELASTNNVLLELYSYDLWRESFITNEQNNFEVMIATLKEMWHRERDIIAFNKEKKTMTEYNALFGQETTTEHFIKGVVNSLTLLWSNLMKPEDYRDSIYEIREQINSICS